MRNGRDVEPVITMDSIENNGSTHYQVYQVDLTQKISEYLIKYRFNDIQEVFTFLDSLSMFYQWKLEIKGEMGH